ncbi:fumarylacetoacetase [Conexibacter sp. SYSU D00693]|uniref:fumarylacetoacetase n=1 Tax=Conexibacter sp. SYSU D00693 TaxID=2812560 RepID=UPI00196AA37D|nr:fumarylacetoacetase [Conexibacter sp. SYSU D00693]
MSGSWVPGADRSGFGLTNLPYGVVRRRGAHPRCAVRIGDFALDLGRLVDAALLDLPAGTFAGTTLNRFLELGPAVWAATRRRLTDLLTEGAPEAAAVGDALVALGDVEVVMPVAVGDFVDGYASLEHATNLGRIFRPDGAPLLANWRHLPVAYHGRAGTVVPSTTPIRRPQGQRPPDAPGARPTFGPERQLDVEVELGFVTGAGPALGRPIEIRDVADHVFGVVLLNDWSARELQRWEYQPLGPFTGKSFATSISPWMVPLDALAGRRVAGPVQEPEPLPYLRTPEPWGLDVDLELELNGTVVSRVNARGLYWNVAQLLAQATVSGATVAAGDLFATGTISGQGPASQGSLVELTWGGRQPLRLEDGTQRTFLEDGDVVVIRGAAGAVSFGSVRGRVEPAR